MNINCPIFDETEKFRILDAPERDLKYSIILRHCEERSNLIIYKDCFGLKTLAMTTYVSRFNTFPKGLKI